MQFKEWLINEDASHYLPELTQKLRQINSDDIFVHFSKINKVGVKPFAGHSDPYGIYAFPKSYILGNRIAENSYFYGMPYAFILQLNPGSKVLDLSKITFQQIKQWFPDFDLENNKEALNPLKSAGVVFWEMLKNIYDNQSSRAQTSMAKYRFFKKLNFDAIYDPGLAIIHSNEPAQVVFLTRCFKVLDVVENKPKIILKKGLVRYVVEKIAKALFGDFRLNYKQSVTYEKNIKALGQRNGLPGTLSLSYGVENPGADLIGRLILSYPNQNYVTTDVYINAHMDHQEIESTIQSVIKKLEKFKPENYENHTEKVQEKLREVARLLGFKDDVKTTGENNATFVKHYSFGKLLANFSHYKGENTFNLTFKGKDDLPSLYGTVEGNFEAKDMVERAFNKWEQAILTHYNPNTKQDDDYYRWKNGLTGEKLMRVLNFFKKKLNRSLQYQSNFV